MLCAGAAAKAASQHLWLLSVQVWELSLSPPTVQLLAAFPDGILVVPLNRAKPERSVTAREQFGPSMPGVPWVDVRGGPGHGAVSATAAAWQSSSECNLAVLGFGTLRAGCWLQPGPLLRGL